MAIYRRPITTVQIANGSYTTILTVPSNYDAMISLTLCNDAASSVSFSLHKVPSGGSPGDDNLIINSKVLGDKESYGCPELDGLVFGPGETLQGTASASSQITVTGGYIQIARSTV